MQVQAPVSGATGCLEVVVIYTGQKETLVALRAAGQLAPDLHATIQVLVPEIVPYPLDLHRPPVAEAHAVRKFETLAEGQRVATKVQRVLCREPKDAIKQAIGPHSVVVIGERKHWWTRGESRLAKHLRALGHEVISVAARRKTADWFGLP